MKFFHYFSRPLNWDPLVFLHHPIVQNEIINRNLDLSIISNHFHVNLKKGNSLLNCVHGYQRYQAYMAKFLIGEQSIFRPKKVKAPLDVPKETELLQQT